MDLNEAIKETKKVIGEIIAKGGKDYDAKTRLIVLMEEVGELANAITIQEGDRPEKARRAELVDSVCDVLLICLFLLTCTGLISTRNIPRFWDMCGEGIREGNLRSEVKRGD